MPAKTYRLAIHSGRDSFRFVGSYTTRNQAVLAKLSHPGAFIVEAA